MHRDTSMIILLPVAVCTLSSVLAPITSLEGPVERMKKREGFVTSVVQVHV